MSDPRVRSPGYPFEPLGAKDPRFEIGSHLLEEKRILLARCEDLTGFSPRELAVRLTMTCPDARLMCSLTLGFVTTVPNDPVSGFYEYRCHLAATVDLGGDPVPVEDLIGTAAVPDTGLASTSAVTLLGWTYSPTEEVEAMRADLNLGCANNYKAGRWWARARWQALRPMSEMEWRDAVAKCLLLSDKHDVLMAYGPPG